MHTGRRIFYRFGSFGRSARETMISLNQNDNEPAAVERISVADFFAKKYRRLLYPDLPCINALKGARTQTNWLPMEVVRVSTINLRVSIEIEISILDCRMAACIETIG